MKNKTLFCALLVTLLAELALVFLTGTARAASPAYPAAVLADGPLAYYRFNDSLSRSNVNVNSGSLGAPGNATNLNLHLVQGAISGSRNPATYFDSTARTIIPWNAAINPPATQDFTVE